MGMYCPDGNEWLYCGQNANFELFAIIATMFTPTRNKGGQVICKVAEKGDPPTLLVRVVSNIFITLIYSLFGVSFW